jgi:hypothetical protein
LKENVGLDENMCSRCEDVVYQKLMTKGEYREGIEKVFGREARPHVIFHLHDEYPYSEPERIKTSYILQS